MVDYRPLSFIERRPVCLQWDSYQTEKVVAPKGAEQVTEGTSEQ